MEYCGNGDLGGYIRRLKEKNKYADEDFIWTIFAQLVGALYRCHYGEDPPTPGRESGVKRAKSLVSKQGHTVILHRDLKPENGKRILPATPLYHLLTYRLYSIPRREQQCQAWRLRPLKNYRFARLCQHLRWHPILYEPRNLCSRALFAFLRHLVIRMHYL
jgi:hypothetical protein